MSQSACLRHSVLLAATTVKSGSPNKTGVRQTVTHVAGLIIHEKNVPGGCWSFKVTKGNLCKTWLNLSAYLCGESLIANKKNFDLLNGISISPKKNFCKPVHSSTSSSLVPHR